MIVQDLSRRWERASASFYPIIAVAVILWHDPFGVVDAVHDGHGYELGPDR